ncbi:hypothetical protein DOY81_005269, partial [Sarcophaga bullata]
IHQQIDLCRVCDDFKAVIVQYIWRRKYRRLRVYQLKDDLFILNRNYKRGVVGRAAFKCERFERVRKNEIEMFLLLQKENIFDLELCDYRGRVYTGLPHVFINTDWNFPNLRTLKLYSIQLHLEHFNLIKNNCLNLKVLCMNHCLNHDLDIFMLKDEYDPLYNGLLDVVKMLTEFHMEFKSTRSSPYPLNLYHFLYEYNLKVLHFNMPINNLDYCPIPVMQENTCEVLHLAAINQYRVIEKFTRLYLNAFKNLQILTLEGSLSKLLIFTNFIQQLAVSAPKLKNLKLKRCDIDVDDFRVLKNLTDVTFDNCMSLTWKNMNQLLQSKHIHTYSSNHSYYIGEFNSISLSDNLERLTLVGFEERFQHIYANDKKPCKNLKFLHYHDGTCKRFSSMSVNFPNLEILQILPYHLVSDDFLCLTKLEIYKNSHFNHEITLRELLFIIKHPKLHELSLTYCQRIIEYTFKPSPAQLKTNIKYVNLDFPMFNHSREPWYSILKINPGLTIIVRAYDIKNLEYYYNILKDEDFSRKYIRLSGFYFDNDHIHNTREIAEEKITMATQIALHRDLHIV